MVANPNISNFVNVPVGQSQIKRRNCDEAPELRKRQKLDPPISTSTNQVLTATFLKDLDYV